MNISKIKTQIFFFFFIFFVFNFPNVAFMDAPHPWQVGFQDPATPIMEGIIFFNGLLMTFMLFIACFVGWLLYQSLTLFNEATHAEPASFNHSTLLEVVWTIIPAGILMIISVPSYNLLYAMEEVIDPSLTIKVVGHQWYWSYECSDFEVSPKVTKDNLEVIEKSFKNLKNWVDVIEYSHVETSPNEVQTQIALVKDSLSLIEKGLKFFPKDVSDKLSDRLDMLSLEILNNERYKEYYGPIESRPGGEMVSILMEARKELQELSLLPEQQELVIKILKTFKQYLRIAEQSELSALKIALFDALGKIKAGENNSISDILSSELKKVSENKKKAETILLADEMLNNCNGDCDDALETIKNLIIKGSQNLNKELGDERDIRHVGLSRSQREAYLAEAELGRANEELDFAEEELFQANAVLDIATTNSKWASIDLAAAKVNKASAANIKAQADAAVTSPSLIRGRLLLEEGFDGWTEEWRLKTKEISDAAKAALIKAKEEFKSAKEVLYITSLGFSSEELNKAKSIASSAEAEFALVEEEFALVEEELNKANIILRSADEDLKFFSSISDRAEKRLNKAKIEYAAAKALSDRTIAEVNGAKAVFEDATVKLNNSEISKRPLEQTFLDNKFSSLSSMQDEANESFIKAKGELENCENLLGATKSELIRAEARLETVKGYVDKTTTILEDTPLIYEEDRNPEDPISYFDNFTWEVHNRDLIVVESQLKSAKSELFAAQAAFNDAVTKSNRAIENLVDSALTREKVALNLAKTEYSRLELLYSAEESGALKKSLESAKSVYVRAEKSLVNLELVLADSINKEARLERYRATNEENLIFAENLITKSKENLVNLECKLNELSSKSPDKGSVKMGSESSFDTEDLSSLYSNYAEISLIKIKEELIRAELDLNKAAGTLDNTDILLNKLHQNLINVSKVLDKNIIEKHWSAYNLACENFTKTVENLKKSESDLSLLDIKMNPGLLETKTHMQVLLADAELDNAKWICARFSDTINKNLKKIKAANVLLSNNSIGDSSSDGGSNSNNISPVDGNSDKDDFNKVPESFGKSNEDIKKMLSEIEGKEISYDRANLFIEILRTFKDLVENLGEEDVDNVRNLLYQLLPSMIGEEMAKHARIKTHIDLILDIINNSNEEEVSERQTINFDSYLIADDDLAIPEAYGSGKAGKVFRLLEVDNRLLVPTNTHIRVLVTSADVLHSWAVPSLGVKVDACPGRLNQVFLFVKREGVFYGQCSELCGVNHGFMPIVVQAVNQDDYLTWVGKRLCS